MLKKILYCLALMIVVGISALSMTACCSNNCVIKVTFLNVDPNMGVSDYRYTVDYRDATIQQFVIPEGYEHASMTATINGFEFTNYEIAYEDEKYYSEDEVDHRYSTKKTITFQVNPVVGDLDIVFDMTDVKLQQFDINLSSTLYNLGKPVEEDAKNKPFFQIMSINPDHGANFLSLGTDNYYSIDNMTSNSISVDYGKHIILVYTNQGGNADINTLYSDIGYFTPNEKVLQWGDVNYSKLSASKRGNTYYTYRNSNGVEINVNNTRLFYIGKLQEDINFYHTIPGYVEEKGFKFDKDPNTFYFLTNKQTETTTTGGVEYTNEYEVEISFFKKSTTTVEMYDENKENPETLEDNQNLDKLKFTSIDEESDEEIINYTIIEKMKPSGTMVDRYDIYKYYIGDNLLTDNLLNSDQKSQMTDELYISVKSDLFGLPIYKNGELKPIKICLINYEKEGAGNSNYPYHELEFNITPSQSDKGVQYIKITKEMIERYFLQRIGVPGDEEVKYNIGSAILYTTMTQAYTDAARNVNEHPYFTIYNRIYYDGSYVDDSPVDYDYKLDFIIIDEDNKTYNYGFVDHSIDDDLNENHTMFKITDLYDYINGVWEFKNNLYVRIEGPKYVDELSPTISGVTIFNNVKEIIYDTQKVVDPQNYNGILLSINLGGTVGVNPITINSYGGPGRAQTAYNVFLTKNARVNNQLKVDFSGLNMDQTTKIYATNSKVIKSIEDFKRIDYITYDDISVLNINIGQSSDLMFFILNDSKIKDFDIYYSPNAEDKRKITATKKLLDIAGNPVRIAVNGTVYDVCVKYLIEDFYQTYNNSHTLYAR